MESSGHGIFMLLLQYLLWEKSNCCPQNHLENTATDCTDQQCCVWLWTIKLNYQNVQWNKLIPRVWSTDKVQLLYIRDRTGRQRWNEECSHGPPMELVNCSDHSKPDWNFIMYVTLKSIKCSIIPCFLALSHSHTETKHLYRARWMREGSFTSYVTCKVQYFKIIHAALSISFCKISSFQNCVFCLNTR